MLALGLWELLIQAWFLDLGIVVTALLIWKLWSRSHDSE